MPTLAPDALNVANLYPEWFAQVAAGSKTREYRERKAIDPVLERVRKGEMVLFRETGGSGRAVLCMLTSRRRRTRTADYLYVFGLEKPVPAAVVRLGGGRVPLRQGWRRVTGYSVRSVGVEGSTAMFVFALPW